MPFPETQVPTSESTFEDGAPIQGSSHSTNRSTFTAHDVIREIWTSLNLPRSSLTSLDLSDSHSNPALPSSYKLGVLAQSAIAISALAAAQIHALRNNLPAPPKVKVPLKHAIIEFKSERLYTLDGNPPASAWGSIGGLHKTSDGYVRIHDSFPNHRNGILELVGLPHTATREELAEKMLLWKAVELENVATGEGKLAVYALRAYDQWDMLPQARAIGDLPVEMTPINPVTSIGSMKPRESQTATMAPMDGEGAPTADIDFPQWMPPGNKQALSGLRVVEMSRVIAAPVCGKTLAAHGADVIWVNSPSLPYLPSLDIDLSRGKRRVEIDIHKPEDKAQLLKLLSTADVFIQGFRPGALAKYGLSEDELVKINPGIIVANLSAFGPRGPWSGRRGFDSLVQTCSGMNVSEAQHAGVEGQATRPMPCQALDHGSGYLLAAGVMAAVYRRAINGGSACRVDVSLAGVMKYLRSLGQYDGRTGFDGMGDIKNADDVDEEYLETRETGFGVLKAVRHSAQVERCNVGWRVMPRPPASDKVDWSD